MSLIKLINEGYTPEADPGFISDAAMESLYLAILTEGLSPEEMDELVTESANFEGVFEAQKNIVRLNKQAKLNRAYKTAVLQCAAEDKRKEYKKLRTLWKMEAALFKKLERQYKNKALSRAKVAVKELAKKKSNPIATAAKRIDERMATAGKKLDKAVGGADKLLKSGVVKKK